MRSPPDRPSRNSVADRKSFLSDTGEVRMTVENPAARNEPAIAALVELYGRHGFEILTGMQAKFVGGKLTDSTYIVKNMATLTGHLGISLVEIYFLETLFFDYQPKNIFVVGNSFGWSSFALALLNRSSKIVAI